MWRLNLSFSRASDLATRGSRWSVIHALALTLAGKDIPEPVTSSPSTTTGPALPVEHQDPFKAANQRRAHGRNARQDPSPPPPEVVHPHQLFAELTRDKATQERYEPKRYLLGTMQLVLVNAKKTVSWHASEGGGAFPVRRLGDGNFDAAPSHWFVGRSNDRAAYLQRLSRVLFTDGEVEVVSEFDDGFVKITVGEEEYEAHAKTHKAHKAIPTRWADYQTIIGEKAGTNEINIGAFNIDEVHWYEFEESEPDRKRGRNKPKTVVMPGTRLLGWLSEEQSLQSWKEGVGQNVEEAAPEGAGKALVPCLASMLYWLSRDAATAPAETPSGQGSRYLQDYALLANEAMADWMGGASELGKAKGITQGVTVRDEAVEYFVRALVNEYATDESGREWISAAFPVHTSPLAHKRGDGRRFTEFFSFFQVGADITPPNKALTVADARNYNSVGFKGYDEVWNLPVGVWRALADLCTEAGKGEFGFLLEPQDSPKPKEVRASNFAVFVPPDAGWGDDQPSLRRLQTKYTALRTEMEAGRPRGQGLLPIVGWGMFFGGEVDDREEQYNHHNTNPIRIRVSDTSYLDNAVASERRDKALFAEYLRSMPPYLRERNVVLDNAPIHWVNRGTLTIQSELEKLFTASTFVNLPPARPELNAVEVFFAVCKRRVAKAVLDDLGAGTLQRSYLSHVLAKVLKEPEQGTGDGWRTISVNLARKSGWWTEAQGMRNADREADTGAPTLPSVASAAAADVQGALVRSRTLNEQLRDKIRARGEVGRGRYRPTAERLDRVTRG